MDISRLKINARKLMVENAPKLFFVSIFFVIVTTIMAELIFRLPGVSNAYNLFLERVGKGEIPAPETFYSNLRPSGVALAAALWVLQPVIKVGYMRYCLKITRGESGDYKDIFDGFLFFGKTILISVISSVLILLWSTLFLFPAIPAYYRYRQAYYILLDAPGKSALQCIRESKRMMAGNKLDLFLFDFSFVGWALLDLVVVMLLPVPFTLPLIEIWLTPYYSLSQAAYYNQLIAKLLV